MRQPSLWRAKGLVAMSWPSGRSSRTVGRGFLGGRFPRGGAEGVGAGGIFVPKSSGVGGLRKPHKKKTTHRRRMTMSIPKLDFPPFHLPPEAEALRGEVRSFLKE